MIAPKNGLLKICLGSGQRPHDSNFWYNIDCRSQGYPVDIITDIKDLSMFEDNSVDILVAHHVVEHLPIHELEDYVTEWYRVLKPNGKLAIFVPHILKLFEGFKQNKINMFLLNANIFGAYQGYITDLHRWGYNEQELFDRISCKNNDANEFKFHWKKVEYINQVTLNSSEYSGHDAVLDWYILAMEFTK